jgi:hypothetical protein
MSVACEGDDVDVEGNSRKTGRLGAVDAREACRGARDAFLDARDGSCDARNASDDRTPPTSPV